MYHICNLVHHENKLNQSGFCQKWSKSPNLSPYRKLFVNNFALVNYSKLKYVHKVDIIMLLVDHICNLIHHENKLKLIGKYCQKWSKITEFESLSVVVCE